MALFTTIPARETIQIPVVITEMVAPVPMLPQNTPIVLNATEPTIISGLTPELN